MACLPSWKFVIIPWLRVNEARQPASESERMRISVTALSPAMATRKARSPSVAAATSGQRAIRQMESSAGMSFSGAPQSGAESNDQEPASGPQLQVRVSPHRSNCSPHRKAPFKFTMPPLRRRRSPLRVHPSSVDWNSNVQRSLLRQPAASSTVKRSRMAG